MATEVERKETGLTGLSESEAREFHRIFMQSFAVFVGVAFIAHILVWLWRPWLPGEEGYALLEGARTVAQSAMTMLG